MFGCTKNKKMNTTQAIIVLLNGNRKYGTIINECNEDEIKFIPALNIQAINQTQIVSLIERIPVGSIYSIDTYLK